MPEEKGKGPFERMLHWYFAYGSNLHRERLEKRIDRTNLECQVAYLDGYKLSFNKPADDGSGYAMISQCEGETVYGVLYALHEAELKKLDRYEGVPSHYVRRRIPVTALNRDVISAQTYFAVSQSDGLKPRRNYLDLIIAGARSHELPPHYIARLESVPPFGLER